jgi:hypothetical protein
VASNVKKAKAEPALALMRRLLRWRYADVAIHLVAVGVIAAAWLSTENVPLTLQLGGWVVGITYIGLMAIEMARAPAIVSPLSYYFLWYSIGSGLAAFSFARRILEYDRILLGGLEVHPSDLASGYVLVLIGSVAFHFGIQVLRPLQAHLAKPASDDGSRRYPGLLLLIWLAGIIARLFGNPNTPAGALVGILSWGSNAALCAYALSTSKEKPRVSWAVLIIGCLIEFVCNLQSFSKAYLMYSFVSIIWTCVYFRRTRLWLLPLMGALAALYLLIIAPVVTRARMQESVEEGDSYANRLLTQYSNYSLSETNISEELEKFFDRQFDPTPAGFIHGEVEKYGFLYGETLDYLAYAFIPRLIWSDKPSVSRGTWFTVYLGGASSEEDAHTSTGLTAAGELYWNFGLWGVIVGMILVGLSVGALWRMVGAVPFSDPLRMLVYFSLVMLVVDSGQAGVMFVALVHRMLVFGPLILLWDRTRMALPRHHHLSSRGIPKVLLGERSWVPRR